MTTNEGKDTELTAQNLREAIPKIWPSEEWLERLEVSPNIQRRLRVKSSFGLYVAPSPHTLIASYHGIKIISCAELPDRAIIFVYKTSQGERKELKVLDL